MNTTPESRADIYARLVGGDPPTAQEVEELLEDASLGDQATAQLDAVTDALEHMGYQTVDVTTDDSEQIEVMIVPAGYE